MGALLAASVGYAQTTTTDCSNLVPNHVHCQSKTAPSLDASVISEIGNSGADAQARRLELQKLQLQNQVLEEQIRTMQAQRAEADRLAAEQAQLAQREQALHEAEQKQTTGNASSSSPSTSRPVTTEAELARLKCVEQFDAAPPNDPAAGKQLTSCLNAVRRD